MDIDKIGIKYNGDVRTIGSMKKELEAGRASYWHWHTLLYDCIHLHTKIKNIADYGILMPNVPMFGKISCYDLEGNISQGGYNQEALILMIDMYAFLYNENIIFQEDEDGQEGHYGAY